MKQFSEYILSTQRIYDITPLKTETMTKQEILISKLSEDLATATEWDGLLIVKVFLDALTDANFHSLRKEIEPIILNSKNL